MRTHPFILLAALSGAVLAQSTSPLKLVLELDRVTTVQEDGKTVEKLVDATAGVQTGDVLVQQATASNVSKSTLNRIAVNVPVPANTVYSGQPTPAGNALALEFSYDGGKTFGVAPLREVVEVKENGKTVKKQVVVPPSRYTNVRWTIASLNPDESRKLSFRVKVK